MEQKALVVRHFSSKVGPDWVQGAPSSLEKSQSSLPPDRGGATPCNDECHPSFRRENNTVYCNLQKLISNGEGKGLNRNLYPITFLLEVLPCFRSVQYFGGEDQSFLHLFLLTSLFLCCCTILKLCQVLHFWTLCRATLNGIMKSTGSLQPTFTFLPDLSYLLAFAQ